MFSKAITTKKPIRIEIINPVKNSGNFFKVFNLGEIDMARRKSKNGGNSYQLIGKLNNHKLKPKKRKKDSKERPNSLITA